MTVKHTAQVLRSHFSYPSPGPTNSAPRKRASYQVYYSYKQMFDVGVSGVLSPVLGSSRNTTLGFPIMAMATDSFRLFPPLSSHAYRASHDNTQQQGEELC